MNLFVLILLTAPVVLLLVVVRKRSQVSRVRAATVSIQADANGITRTLADGRTEAVSWDEVNEVDVFRTRVGPHKPAGGGVVLYGTADRGCIVPLDRLEESSLLVHIGHLPGFDVGVLLKAVGGDADGLSPSAGSMQFLTPKPLQTTITCWTRTHPEDEGPERDDQDEPEGDDHERD